ncbi:stromal membrane-associated protein [Reticulomyxa filosa]|uniref:Stromal membrane-associated protein n=1 Tax=Reticulomyxa filosa TaxID=46433 RepID=X6MW62_RETFI|nr:stromal membrane-associated protein [Reticulomyxa filosa]|eukprot:ETO17340.1 stromal membrane-associated protein [Reticulomyxa filosa]
MGTHITKIRSFRLDTNAWTDEIMRTFEKVGGNEKVNTYVWEALLPSYWMNPKWDKCEAIREHFIRMKYERRMFLPPDPTKINPCVRRMPVEVIQGYIDCKSSDSKKWTTQWAVLHSSIHFFFFFLESIYTHSLIFFYMNIKKKIRWFSRYAGIKKTETKFRVIDISTCRLIVEEQQTNDPSAGYVFLLYEDRSPEGLRNAYSGVGLNSNGLLSFEETNDGKSSSALNHAQTNNEQKNTNKKSLDNSLVRSALTSAEICKRG